VSGRVQPLADNGHVRLLPKVHVSMPEQAHDLLCNASPLHQRTVSRPRRGKRILSQGLAQGLGRVNLRNRSLNGNPNHALGTTALDLAVKAPVPASFMAATRNT
jgi:hypothetical protein